MSQVIDTKVVEMKFDNADFEKNVKQSQTTLDQLKKDLDLSGSADSFGKISKAASEVSFDGLNSGVETVKTHFSALEVTATAALWNITQKAVDAGLAMAKSLTVDLVTDGMDQYGAKAKAVQTIMNATGQSINTVDAALEKLIWFTDETSYSFSDMTDNIGKFTSMGIGLDDSVSAMMGVSNWAAVSGAGIQEASRAMYNLSQAMGVGAVKLQDWKSIENANMATKEFKEQVLETAKALGTLDQFGYDAKGELVDISTFSSTLKDGWFTSDVLLKVLNDYSAFSDQVYERVKETGEACSKAMQYVREYGESFSEVAEKAFRAAQEARTFKDAVDAVKDAVKSQWATLFENVFGNYEDAKVTWTGLANSLWTVFAEPLSDVNEQFQEALAAPTIDLSDWNQMRDEIKNNLGLSSDEFKNFEELLKEVARENGIDVDSMVDKWGGFAASLQEGWLDSDLMNQALQSIEEGAVSAEDALANIQDVVDKIWNGDFGNGDDRKKALEELGYNYEEIQKLVEKGFGADLTVDDLTESMLEAVGATKKEVDALNKIKEAVQSGDLALTNEIISQISGRELRNMFWSNLFNDENGAIVSYVGAFRDAFSNIFGTIESGDIRNVIEGLYEFSEKLLEPTRIENFQTRMENIFHTLHSVLEVIKGVWEIVKTIAGNTVVPLFKGLADIIMAIADGIGGLLTSLDEGVSSMTFFGDAAAWLSDKLSPVKKVIEAVSQGIMKFINAIFDGENVFKAFKESVEWIIDKLFGPTLEGSFAKIKFNKFIDNISELKDAVVETFGTIGDTFSNAWQIFQNTELGQSISGFTEKVKEALSTAWDAIKKWFNNLFTGSDLVDEDIDIFGGIQSALTRFNNWLKNLDLETAIESVSTAVMGFEEKIKNTFSRIKTYFDENETFQNVMSMIKSKFTELKDSLKSDDDKEEKEPFATRVLEKMKSLLEWFKDNLPSIGEIIGIIRGILKSATFVSLIKLINQIRNLFNGGQTFLTNINKVIKGVGKALTGIAVKNVGLGILAMAGAVALLSASLIALTLVDTNKLQSVGLVIAGVAAGFGLLAIGISDLMKAMGQKNASDAAAASLEKITDSISGFINNVGDALATSIKLGAYAKLLVSLAVAMGILAAAVYAFSTIDTDKLIQGLVAAIALIAALTASMKVMASGTSSSFSFSKSGLSMSNSGMGGIGSGFGFIGMAVALLIFARVIDQLGQFDMQKLLQGVIALGVVLGEVAVFTRLAKSTTFSSGVGLAATGAAMLLFVKSIEGLAEIKFEKLLQAILALGAILVEVAAFTRLSYTMSVGDGLGLVAVAASMIVFAKAIEQLSAISPDKMLSGLFGLATILAEIAVFTWVLDKVASSTENLSMMLFSIAAVILAVSAAVWVLADAINKGIDLGEIGRQLSNLISSLVTGLIDAIVNSADAIIGGILSLLSTLATYAPQMVDILVELVTGVLDALTVRLPELATSIANFCGALIDSFAEAFKEVDTTSLINAINELLIATASLVVIGKFGSLGSVAKGIGMLAEVIGAFGLIIAVFGALNLIPGFTDFMNGGVEALITVAHGIGSFFGEIVGSFAGTVVESFSSSLPSIGQNLSDFMTNLQPFIDNCSKIDSSVLSGIGNLTLAMLEITGASFVDTVLNGIGKLFGYDAKKDFISSFQDLGEGLVAFAETIKGVDFSAVEGAANAAQVLTTLISIYPAENTLFDWLTGTKDFSKAKDTFSQLGQGVAGFCNAIGGTTVDEATVTSAAKAISSLINIVPNSDGVWQHLFGEKDFSNVGTTFRQLGIGVANFCKSIAGVTIDEGTVTAAANSIKVLVDTVPLEGGFWEGIVGKKDFSKANGTFTQLGLGVANFCKAIGGVTIDETTVSAAATSLQTLIDIVPREDGIWNGIIGHQDFTSVRSTFTQLGLGVAGFCKAIGSSTINEEVVDAAASAIETLMDIVPNEGGLWSIIGGSQNFDSIDRSFTQLGLGVAHFCKAIQGVSIDDSTAKAATVAAGMIQSLTDVTPKTDGIWQHIFGETDLGKLGSNMGILGEGIAQFVEKTGNTTRTSVERGKIAAQGLIDIMTLKWPPTSGGLIGWIKDAFDGSSGITDFDSLNENFGKIGTMAQTLATSFNDVGTDSIANAKIAANAIIDLINMPWPATDTGIFGWIGNLFSGGDTNWDKLQTELPKMGAAIKGFADSASGINANAAVNASICAGTLKQLTTMITDSKESLSSIPDFATYITQLSEAMVKFASDVATINYAMVTLAVSAISALLTVLASMSSINFDTASGFPTALGNLANDGINKFAQAFSDSEEKVKNTVSQFVKAIIKTVQDTQAFYDAGEDDGKHYDSGLSGQHDTIVATAKKIFDDALAELSDAKSFNDSGSTNGENYNTGLSSWNNKVVLTAKNMAENILTALTRNMSFYNTGSESGKNYYNGFHAWDETIKTYVSTLIGNLLLTLSVYNSFYNAGGKDGNGFYDGLSSWATNISTATSNIGSNAASNMQNYNGFFNSGQWAMFGFYKGMYDWAPNVYAAAREIAANAKAAADAELKTASPSREMYQRGKWFDQGLALGIQDYGYAVDKAASSMASSPIDLVTSILEGMNFDNLDASPVIRPVLDLSNIQNGANVINDLLYTESAVGLNAMAATRLANSINRLNGDAVINGLYDDTDMIAVVTDLGGKVDELNEAINNMKLYIDKKDLVGGIVNDMDKALSRLSTKQSKGVM